MLDIMKAIYDMMGKCTYPILKEETPRQHVEVFFQASAATNVTKSGEYLEQRLYLFVSPTEDGQEQRRRGDHRRVHRLLPKRKPDDPDSPVRRLARHPLTSLFSLSVRRMKTSCDRCTSLKTSFNFAEDLEEGSSSFVQLGLFTVYSVLCRLPPVDKIPFVAVGHR